MKKTTKFPKKKHIIATKEEIVEKMQEEVRANIPLAQEVLHKNLYKLNKYVLQVEEGQGKVPLAPFHKELCDFVADRSKRKKLILVPRGHLKSTLVTVGYAVQRILENPSIRILIANATYRMATSFLTEIKKHLKHNDKLKLIWGDIAANPEQWSNDAITLAAAKVSHGKKEPTVTAMGLESNLVSQHYDLIIGDDLVNREYVNTAEQIEKTVLFYKDALDLLEPNGEVIFIGTRWDDKDLYGWLMDPENPTHNEFEIFLREAYEGDLDSDEGFISLFPEKFTRRHLKHLYLEKGPYEFSCQYMNNPVEKDNADFKLEWFKYYEPSDMRGAILNKFTMIDPALSLEKDADFSTIVTVGIDQQHNIYMLDIFRERVKPSDLIENIFRINMIYKPTKIAIEQVAFQKTLQYSINEEMQKRNNWIPLVEVKPNNRTKDQRIRGLQPLYASGKMYHNRYINHHPQLEDELLRFPRGKHDDIIDALSYGLDIWFAPRQKISEPRHHRYLYN